MPYKIACVIRAFVGNRNSVVGPFLLLSFGHNWFTFVPFYDSSCICVILKNIILTLLLTLIFISLFRLNDWCTITLMNLKKKSFLSESQSVISYFDKLIIVSSILYDFLHKIA